MRYTTRIIVPPKIRRSGLPGTGGAYRPQVIGVRKSFGFDDPFGLATTGQLGAAERHPDFAPMFAQFNFGQTNLPGRSATEAMAHVLRAVNGGRFRHPWGADANHLRTPQDVEDAAAAGYTYYTLDPSDFLGQGTAEFAPELLAARLQTLIDDGDLPEDWSLHYADRTIDLPGNQRLVLPLEPLQRAAVKYGRAVRHCARLAEAAARASQGRPYEMEACFAVPGPKTTPLEHLFIGLELEARGVRLTSLALPLVQPEDAAGDLEDFEQKLRAHAAVAEFCGPYKLSFHHASLLPSLHPAIARCCGDAMHMKTSHLSYLEALRVVLLTDPRLFEDIAALTRSIPSTLADALQADGEMPDDAAIRSEPFLTKSIELLAETRNEQGQSLHSLVAATLERHADIYQAQLTALFDKRLSLFKAD